MPKITSPWAHSLRLWFLTNVIGALLMAFYYVIITHIIIFYLFYIFYMFLTILITTALFSLPVIPLVVVVFNAILSVHSQRYRLVFSFLTVSGLWLAAFLAAAVAFGALNELKSIVCFAAPYYLSALIAAYLVYRPWLFETNG